MLLAFKKYSNVDGEDLIHGTNEARAKEGRAKKEKVSSENNGRIGSLEDESDRHARRHARKERSVRQRAAEESRMLHIITWPFHSSFQRACRAAWKIGG